MSGTPPRYLVVLCSDWPLVVAGHPPEDPVAVLQSGRLVACSAAARRSGVREGQRRKEAEFYCPELRVVQRDLPGELRAFEPVVAVLEAFGVDVTIREPGWAGFAARGPTRRLGGEEAFAQAVREVVHEVLVTLPPGASGCRVGIGDGPFTATLAARVEAVVPRKETKSFLADHPIGELGERELEEVLVRLGLHTLGAFAALPEAEVLARFGLAGAEAHDRAAGRASAQPRRGEAVLTYAVEERLEFPVEQVDGIALIVRSMGEEFCRALADDGRSCSVIVFEADMTEGDRLVRRWSHDGAWSARLVVERLRWQMEAWLSARVEGERDGNVPRGVERLRLSAEEVGPAVARQLALWGRPPGTDEHVERVLARVQGMLGPEGVTRAYLVGGRGPAERVRLVPFGEPAPAEVSEAALPWPGRLPAPNPITLLAPPLPVDLLVEGGSPLKVNAHGVPNGEPVQLLLEGSRSEVRAWAGPWPVDEQWWQPSSHRRRARLQVVTGEGTGYLLALERGRWLIEGRYD